MEPRELKLWFCVRALDTVIRYRDFFHFIAFKISVTGVIFTIVITSAEVALLAMIYQQRNLI